MAASYAITYPADVDGMVLVDALSEGLRAAETPEEWAHQKIILDGDQFFELREGDSFYFESRRPHSWRNSHDGETVLIWVNTPPTF